VGVQLLSPSLQRQLFPENTAQKPSDTITQISLDHLRDNDLSPAGAAVLPEINFEMPPLQGNNIREHFHRLGDDVAEPYLGLSRRFAEVELPPMPETWCVDQPGWYRYDRASSEARPVEDLADEQLVCFDVEVLYKISPYPVMATAATPNAWYSWLSPAVFAAEDDSKSGIPSTLVPISRTHPDQSRIIVGHNVGYDRSKVLEEYHVERTRNRWLDTLALHVSTKGITSVQRPAWQRRKKEKHQAKEHRSQSERLINEYEGAEHEDVEGGSTGKSADSWDDADRWEDITSANALSEVARLHLGIKVDKAIRDEFGNADITSAAQLRPNLQKLLAYCAKDVDVTHKVLQKVLPLFLLSCPHPASFAGALTMGNPFLPIDKSWKEYIQNADKKYRELAGGVKGVLWELAYKLKQRGKVEGDPWSEQLDWEPKSARWSDPFDLEKSRNAVPDVDAREAVFDSEAAGSGSDGNGTLESLGDETGVEQGKASSESDISNAEEQLKEGEQGILQLLFLKSNLIDVSLVADSSSNPRWLAKGRMWLKGKPTTAKLGDILPYVLQMTYKGHPLVESREHRWLIAVPKDGSNSASDYGEKLSFSHADDYRLEALSDQYTFHRPLTKAKVASPFTKARRADWVSGIFSSPYGDLCMSLLAGELRDHRVSDLNKAVEAFRRDGRDSVQGRVLDWRDANTPTKAKVTPTSTPRKPTPTKPAKRVTGLHGTWPKWFWELVPGGMNALPPGELDLTVRKRVAPLLLRLQWKGFPVFYSREHGWLYRIPKEQWSEDDLTESVGFTKFKDGADAKLEADKFGVFVKIPHHAGKDANVGNPLAKTFLRYIENGTLASAPAEAGSADNDIASAASDAMNMNAQCSYWISARERIIDQMDIYAKDVGTMGFDQAAEKSDNLGIILPRVITMGTVTRRAVEATWLTASNAKKNRVGSELKAMVRAPPGYAIVGADVDSEELWIASVMGDAQFGMHGATAIGWMTLEGTKAAGTDLHSKTAKILKTTRDNAKVFNYSRIYGAGIKHAVQLLKQVNATLTDQEAMDLATNLYVATKGKKTAGNRWKRKEAGAPEDPLKSLWHGGSESYLFNTLESIAASPLPQTPALGCGVTDALKRVYLPKNGPFGTDYLPSRINWVVQSSGVDYLHLLIIGMEYLIKKYGISARYMISVHDELRYLVEEQDKYRAALALQIANAWTRALLCYNLGLHELPQGVTFFSAVDIDRYLRKEVDMPCVTPSQPVPLERGESLDIESLLKITKGDLGPVMDSPGDSVLHRDVTLTQVAAPPDLQSSLHEAYLRVQAGKDEKAALNYIKQYNARQVNFSNSNVDDKDVQHRPGYRTAAVLEDYENID
jgi:DNA polymerase gamma 1